MFTSNINKEVAVNTFKECLQRIINAHNDLTISQSVLNDHYKCLFGYDKETFVTNSFNCLAGKEINLYGNRKHKYDLSVSSYNKVQEEFENMLEVAKEAFNSLTRENSRKRTRLEMLHILRGFEALVEKRPTVEMKEHPGWNKI